MERSSIAAKEDHEALIRSPCAPQHRDVVPSEQRMKTFVVVRYSTKTWPEVDVQNSTDERVFLTPNILWVVTMIRSCACRRVRLAVSDTNSCQLIHFATERSLM